MDNRLRALLLEESTDAIIVTTSEGRVIFWSRGAKEIYGFSSDEASGKLVSSLIIPSDKIGEYHQALNESQTKRMITYETLRKHKNGSLVCVLVTSKSTLNNIGSIEYILSYEKNITERKLQQDTKLIESRFGNLIESIPDGIVIINQTGGIILANTNAKKMFGYAGDELRGRSIEILLPEKFRKPHISHRADYFESPRTRSMGLGLELFGSRKDGTEFQVEISLSPLRLDEGLFVMSAIRDISERIKTENKFKGLLESAPDAIVIVNTEGIIVIVNSQAEELFQYTRDELLGKKIEILIPSRFHTRHVSHRDNYLNEPKNRPMGAGLELHGIRKDGSEFPVEISLSPLETEDGKLISSAIRDITQRKMIETTLRERTAELEGANRDLEAFSYSVSHDLRAPLRAINGFCSILLKEHMEGLKPEMQRYLSLMAHNTVQMGNLIDDLLQFSRLNREQMQKQNFEMSELVKTVVDEIRLTQKDNSISFKINPIPSICADRALMKQVWINLVSNAVKFSRKGVSTIVEIGHRRQNGMVTYFVKDNGIGFDMNHAGKLFGVFQRMHRAEDFEGTGVGLALVHRIIHRHGGKVWAESDPNKGSTFFFSLDKE